MAKRFRKKLVAGNWKMNKSISEARQLATAIRDELASRMDPDVALCPPFTALAAVGEIIGETQIKLGAQNMHWEPSGAFTGEISAGMLRDLYCRYVILGHSERRTYFGETDENVARKVAAALSATLVPIVCVGETLEQRDGGLAREVVKRQLELALGKLGADVKKVVIAYEPVWAIGTGRTARPEQAQEMHAFVRDILEKIGGADAVASVRILYGGSVKASNAHELFHQDDIDGGLIGGASLDARSFLDIVRAAL